MSQANDPSLNAFLDARTDADAWQALDVLLAGPIATLTHDTVTRHLTRSRWMANHIDDVVGEMRVRLTQKLWSLRAGKGEPIENLGAYCTVAAGRACYEFLRRQFPERTRLRNRLRYALTHHPETALAEDAHGLWRCRSEAIRMAAQRGTAQAFLDSPRTHAEDRGIDLSAPLPALAAALLASIDEPVEFNRFVDAVATLLGVSDTRPPASPASPQAADPLSQLRDPAASISDVLEQRDSLVDAWKELIALPLRQRSALLLNLRDPDGGAMLQLLPATGVASRADIAGALAIDEAELARLWEDLPLDDLTIAARLGATRQQVINLRKSARARLARRLERGAP